jgi:acetyl-CoA carboxylase/biotin carboxylase 1
MPLLLPSSCSTAASLSVLIYHAMVACCSPCSVLVANNGLAAVKFMRSIRTWAVQTFGHPRAVAMVAMATPEDIRINAEHVMQADQFVEVPGGTNNNNYANVKLIVQVAERAGVDAVWPGW